MALPPGWRVDTEVSGGMLSFAVFDGSGVAREWPLRKAYLFGPDEVPIQGEVYLEDGVIICEKPVPDAAGLALQFEVGLPPGGAGESRRGGVHKGDAGLGLLTLRTCLLPDRQEPYLLSLELARHRIMMILNKLEQWSLFDLPAEHPVLRQFEAARGEFTAALVALCHRVTTNGVSGPDPASMLEADAAAKRALSLAIDAGEQLALLHGERQLKLRLEGSLFKDASDRASEAMTGDRSIPDGAAKNPDGVGVVMPGPAQVGCAVNPALFSDALARVVAGTCDFVTMPMRWIDMEPTEGKYSFAKTDKWIEWAVRSAKLPVHAGPLIDFREISVPEWLYIWENDYETLRELVYEHIKTIVTRYRRTVARWTVCSGLHVNESFPMTLERMMDLTRMCALLVRKLQPSAKVQIEIAQPWGEYFARNKRSMPPKMYADMIPQAGIMVDAYAVRVQMGQAAAGRSTRDLMAAVDLLDRYAELDKPLCVTAVGVPSQMAGPTANGNGAPPDRAPYTPAHGGWWRSPWTNEVQARWVQQAVSLFASLPYVHSVCWQDLYDAPPGQAEMPFGGLVSETGTIKPAALSLAEVRKAVGARRA
ncbi:MAG: endo-1,4-beta-xylanase [Phycisphaeraceae bacterium]|nr:endo-1,4-beta-xylanase [Phycisphaeraceae bacterium]